MRNIKSVKLNMESPKKETIRTMDKPTQEEYSGMLKFPIKEDMLNRKTQDLQYLTIVFIRKLST